jgi:hypothetical protein
MNKEQQQFLNDLLHQKNYLGAYQYLRELDIEKAERSASIGLVVTAIVEDLSVQPRQSRERVIYLRSVLSYVFKEYPGLTSLYREQLRVAQGKDDLISEVFKGFRNVADVATGRKTVNEGVEEAAEDMKDGFERSTGSSFDDLGKNAEKALRDGLEQVGNFFAGLNRPRTTPPEETPDSDDPTATSGKGSPTGKSSRETGTHTTGSTSQADDDEAEDAVHIKIENADDPLPEDVHEAERD